MTYNIFTCNLHAVSQKVRYSIRSTWAPCTRARGPETPNLKMQLQYIVAMDEKSYSPSTQVALRLHSDHRPGARARSLSQLMWKTETESDTRSGFSPFLGIAVQNTSCDYIVGNYAVLKWRKLKRY